jgi:ketol-acid reductoisomerase
MLLNTSARHINFLTIYFRRNGEAHGGAGMRHPMQIVGKKPRAAMPFLDPVTVEEVAKSR